ncbi:MAG: hypothetical protein MZU97_16700 [Bacillus subtilis]|nr:hypothetical protein [Bacillus subtilis]
MSNRKETNTFRVQVELTETVDPDLLAVGDGRRHGTLSDVQSPLEKRFVLVLSRPQRTAVSSLAAATTRLRRT